MSTPRSRAASTGSTGVTGKLQAGAAVILAESQIERGAALFCGRGLNVTISGAFRDAFSP